MGHVTQPRPFVVICHPKANNWYSLCVHRICRL